MRQLYNKYINNTQSVACVVYFISFNDKLKNQQKLINKKVTECYHPKRTFLILIINKERTIKYTIG